MFVPGDHVLVWVSGGPDSVCLLESLVRLRRLFRVRLSVFHMDHGLRPDSGLDAAYVRRLSARHRLDCHVARPPGGPAKGASSEAWARWERGIAAHEVRDRIGATKYADGHTMNDQAETVLIGLIRGWEMGGIARTNGIQVRPMLDVTRDDVEAFCRALRLRPRRDPTNLDTRLLRNAVRLEVIPAIERATGRGVVETFARAADLQRDASSTLFELADGYVDGVLRPARGGFADPRRAVAGRAGRARADGGAPLLPARGRRMGSGVDRARDRPRPRAAGTTRRPRGGDLGAARPDPRGDRPDDPPPRVDSPPRMDVYDGDIEKVLLTEADIQFKLAEMGEQITEDYAGRSILLVGVLKGAFVVMADLSRHIRLPLEFDFMAVSSYGAATKSSGVVRIMKDLDHDLKDRDVLVVEDIVDSGLTLKYLLKNLAARKPATLEVAALLRKEGIQQVPLDVRYVGFEIPNEFVVGYGLDFGEKYRNLPYIGTLRPSAYGG